MSAPRLARNPIYDHAASQPANQQAGKIIGKGGDVWKPEIKYPPGFVREEVGALPFRNPPPNTLNLMGQRFGSLVVLGLQAEPRKGGTKAAWVVRCDCGAYEHRKAKTLTKGDPKRWHCSNCDYLSELRAGRKPTKTIAERTGKATPP